MTQTNKNANKSFLDKFQGKTTKVGKTGTHAVLTAPKDNKILGQAQSRNDIKRQHKIVKRAINNNEQDIQHQFRKVDLDQLIPSNPQKYYLNKKVNADDDPVKRRQGASRNNRSMQRPAPQYVPSAYTPQATSKDSQTLSSHHPPSRSLSNSTGVNSRGKYMFGKYLKLDKQAMNHMDFLQVIQEKSFFKRNKGESISNI